MDGIRHMPVSSWKVVIVSPFKNNSNNKNGKRKKSRGFTSILVRKFFNLFFQFFWRSEVKRKMNKLLGLS